jgi:hypothetical protein
MKEIYIIYYWDEGDADGNNQEKCIQGYVESREEAEKICSHNEHSLDYEKINKYTNLL